MLVRGKPAQYVIKVKGIVGAVYQVAFALPSPHAPLRFPFTRSGFTGTTSDTNDGIELVISVEGN